MKKRVALLLSMLFIFSIGYTVGAADIEPSIFINGKQIYCDVPPQIIDGRTMVPLSSIAKEFDKNVAWDPVTNRIDITDKLSTVSVDVPQVGTSLTDNSNEETRTDGTIWEYIGPKAMKSKVKVTFPSGAVYEGDQFNGEITGEGKLIYANKDIYEGSFKNGLINGYGEITYYLDGKKFRGYFKDDVQDGPGSKYSYGYWQSGLYVKGYLVYTFPNSQEPIPKPEKPLFDYAGVVVSVIEYINGEKFKFDNYTDRSSTSIGDMTVTLSNNQKWKLSSITPQTITINETQIMIYPYGDGYKAHINGIKDDLNAVQVII